GSFIAERGDVEEGLTVSIDTTCGMDLILVKHCYWGYPSGVRTQGSRRLQLFGMSVRVTVPVQTNTALFLRVGSAAAQEACRRLARYEASYHCGWPPAD